MNDGSACILLFQHIIESPVSFGTVIVAGYNNFVKAFIAAAGKEFLHFGSRKIHIRQSYQDLALFFEYMKNFQHVGIPVTQAAFHGKFKCSTFLRVDPGLVRHKIIDFLQYHFPVAPF